LNFFGRIKTLFKNISTLSRASPELKSALGRVLSKVGIHINAQNALKVTAVFACVRLLSENIASLPLFLYRKTETGKEKATDLPLYGVLHDAPNPETDSFQFWQAFVANMLVYGRGYAEIVRNGAGEVVQLWNITTPYASDYLKYVFGGFVFVGMYNAFAFLLRAFGDSKTPLYFLVASCISNLLLDLLFVAVFRMGTAGAAIATLLTQGFAAVGCGIYTIKRMGFLQFKRKEFVFNTSAFQNIAVYSVLTALQQSISSFGMMLIQGLVNTFGTTVMAAFAADSKIDSVANTPLQDLGNAFSTYTAQNKGAGETKRIREGFRVTSRIIIVLSAIISIVAFVFAPNLITLFVSKDATEVIAVGIGYLRIVSVFYVLLGFIVMFYGFFRGLGEIKISILMTIVSQGLRLLLAYSFAPIKGFSGVCWAIVIGWFLSDLLGFYMYKKVMAKKPC